MPDDFWKYAIMLVVLIGLIIVMKILSNNQAFKDFVRNIKQNKDDAEKLRENLDKTDKSDPNKFPEYKE